MVKHNIDEYFKARGLSVSYNTLGANENLVRSYIENFQGVVDNGKMKMSNHVKHAVYNKLYKLEPRKKYTGFEKFSNLDKEFRTKTAKAINELSWLSSFYIPKKENIIVVGISYKEQLHSYLHTFSKPHLYLSGGMDSEVVGLAMLEAGIKFTPIVFEYIDKNGNVLNSYDFAYAIKFCMKHNLKPIVRKLDIEDLWRDKNFFDKAVEMKIYSPQILTHVHMIELIEKEFSGIDHIFGGEVRFQSDITDENEEKLNLVHSYKAATHVADGQTYTSVATSWGYANASVSNSTPYPLTSTDDGFVFKTSGFPGTAELIGTWWYYNGPQSLFNDRQIFSITWRSTLNSKTGVNPGNTSFYRTQGLTYYGFDNQTVGSTISVSTIDGQSTNVNVDATTTDASMLTNWTCSIISKDPITSYPTPSTPGAVVLSYTVNLNAYSVLNWP